MTRECERSADVGAAIAGGALQSDVDLQAHVDTCESCRDLALVMSALRSEREHARRHAPVPSAGLVWWRLQLRARREAARQATAPMTFMHAAAFVGVIVMVVAVLVLMATTGFGAGASGLGLPSWMTVPSASDVAGGIAGGLAEAPPLLVVGLALGLATWLILAPVALYFAFKRE